MKVAFDENVPQALVRVFQTLVSEGVICGIEFVSARQYVTSIGAGDIPWLEAFAGDGGNIVISGDKRIRSNPYERQAYRDAGLMLFIFASQWNSKTPIVKSAMLLNWWPKLEEYVLAFEPGSCWEIPCQWNLKDLRNVTGPA